MALQNGFLKKFCGSFGIGLFVSSDTCKDKAAYSRISPDVAKVGSHWVMMMSNKKWRRGFRNWKLRSFLGA